MEPETEQNHDENYESIVSSLLFMADRYTVLNSVGDGTFSKVYKAISLRNNTIVALKVVTKTTAPNRIVEELKILRALKGENNCIKLLEVHRNRDQVVMVFPLIKSINFKDFLMTACHRDVQSYMYSLLRGLAHMHSKGIIHRDVKPANFLFDMEMQEGYLIDFGLSHYEQIQKQDEIQKPNPMIFFNSIVTQNKPPGYYEKDCRPPLKAPRSGTRGFRAPEILFKSMDQTTAVDIWSAGIIFLSILTCQYPFFLSLEDVDGLAEISVILGAAKMRETAKHYGRTFRTNLSSVSEEGISLRDIITHLSNKPNVDEMALDLLMKLLDPISNERITAQEAMQHPFFNF